MKEVHTEIEIDAPPNLVWGVFTDLSRFKEWNPFIKEAEGELKTGNQLRMVLQPPGGRSMEFHPKVLSVVQPREIAWQGHIPGIFTGEHHFSLELIGENRTRFKQSSKFTGLATRLVGNEFVEGGRKGFEAMEQAMKQRVEQKQQWRSTV